MSDFDDPRVPDDANDEASAKPDGNRTIKLSVKVNAVEKGQIDKQRSNLSMSEFLRDRALHPFDIHDPTFAAIGGMHMSAENVRRASGKAGSAANAVNNLVTTLYLSDLSGLAPSDLAMRLDAITSAIDEFREVKERLEAALQSLSQQGQALSREHLGQLTKVHPAYSLKKRPVR
jgi:hypothetical protein